MSIVELILFSGALILLSIFIFFVIRESIKDIYSRHKEKLNKERKINDIYNIMDYFLKEFDKLPLKKTDTVSSGVGEINHYHYQPQQVAITSTVDEMEVTVTFWNMNPEDAEMTLPKLLKWAAEKYVADEIELGTSIIVKGTTIDLYLQEDELAIRYLNYLCIKVLNTTFSTLIDKEYEKAYNEKRMLEFGTKLFMDKINKRV